MRDAPNFETEETVAAELKTKSEYHKLATSLANKIIQLDHSSSVTFLARGELGLLTGDFEKSMEPFKMVLDASNDSNLFGQLGRARILYHNKNYKGALKIYQRILKSRPDFQPDPRIGIGLCFWHINEKDMALAAWQRALELRPESIPVNVLLGLYYMDEAVKNPDDPSFAATYIKALKYTQTAYKLNKNYPAADLVIASYLFSKKDIDSVIKLAERAVQYSNVKSIQSDAYFWMARAYHYLDNLPEALKYYTMAEKENPNNLVAKIGKGLVQMAQNDNESLMTFESIVKKHPKSTEALFLLALYYVQRWQSNPMVSEKEYKDRAVVYLEKFMRMTKEQDEAPPIEALLTLAKLTEDKNITASLNTLNDVIQLLTSQEIPVNAELYNNIGVLHYTKGSYESARTFFDLAKTAVENGHSYHGEDIKTSINFNIARLEDASGNIEEAKRLYAEILETHPDYLSARIRSVYLSLALGEPDSPEKIKELMSQHSDDVEVRALYGYYLKRQKRPPSKSLTTDIEMKHHKTTLEKYEKFDTYALVAIGNMYLTVARSLKINSSNDVKKKEWTYYKAAESFERALQVDKYNAYAAQGVAIIFAETKQSDKALQIFSKIRETLNDVSIYVNMGDCLVDLRQYSKAIESYEIALNRFHNGEDLQLFILLGRAWYARGMSEKNFEALKKSLFYSEKAFEGLPENTSLKFNVAFVRFQMAEFILRLPERQRTIIDIEKAIKGLDSAIEYMEEIAGARHPPFPPEEIQQRIKMGKNTTKKQLERALVEQKEFELKFQDKIEEARKIREAEKAKLEMERKAKAEAEAERQAALLKERLALQEQAREWTEQAAQAAIEAEDQDGDEGENKRSKSKRTSRKSGGGSKKEGKGRKRRSKKSNPVDSEEEEEAQYNDSEPEREREVRKKSSSNSKKQFKSVSDIEDSDDGLDEVDAREALNVQSMEANRKTIEEDEEPEIKEPRKRLRKANFQEEEEEEEPEDYDEDQEKGDDDDDDDSRKRSPEEDEASAGSNKKRRLGRVIDDDEDEEMD